MAYTITNSDGATIQVQDTTVDTTYALKLIGRNVSGYGQYFVENTVRHLENFASTVQPSGKKLEGQIWYDKGEKLLKVWTGSNWKRATNIVIGTSEPTNSVAGDAWYRTDNKKLYIYDGSEFALSGYAGEVSNAFNTNSALGNPNNYGTKLRNIYLTDSSGIKRSVLALTSVDDGITTKAGVTVTANGRETIMAIFSNNDEFTVANENSISEGSQINYFTELSGSNSIGTQIKPGLNLRRDYKSTAVALSERAYRSDAAYQLNLGSLEDGDAGNITAKQVARKNESYIPDSNGLTLGNASNQWASLYVNSIFIGDGGATAINVNGTLNIGDNANRVSKIWSQDLDVSGDITFGSGVQNIGASGTPVENFYTANAVVSSSFTIGTSGSAYTLPSADASSANLALISDGSGTVSFAPVPLTTTEMIAGAGLSGGGTLASDRTFNVGAGYGITVAANLVSVDGTVSADASKVVVRTGSGGINSVGLDAGAGTIETTGTVRGGTVTDGTLSISSGSITSGATATFSGNVDAANFNGVASSAKYADLAEIYEADADYEPGTVVKIGGEKEITQTSSHADLEVFGVISTDPAYLMNSDASGLPVALQGRVPVKVVGKIKKGERLVASDEPGYAWGLGSDEYDPRSIIGRALQDKEDGGLGIIEAVIGIK